MGEWDNDLEKDASKKGWLTSILELGAWLGTLLSGQSILIVSRKVEIQPVTNQFQVSSRNRSRENIVLLLQPWSSSLAWSSKPPPLLPGITPFWLADSSRKLRSVVI